MGIPFRGLWLILMSLTMLSACGFHLRGHYSLPAHLQTMELQSADPYAAITRQISKRLKQGGITLVPSADERTPRLILGEETLERSNLSLYTDGQVAEYRLLYKLNATLILPDEAPQALSLQVQRDYQDDPSEALAKRRELELLLDEMRQQIANQLIIKLASY